MRKKIIIMFTIIWVVVIYFNSLQTGVESLQMSNPIVSLANNIIQWLGFREVNYLTLSLWIRKLAHLFEYTLLGILIILTFLESNLSDKYRLIYSFTLSVLIAVIDEVMQTFVENRSGSVNDVLIDSLGIILGIGFIILLNIIRMKKSKKEDNSEDRDIH